MEIVCLLVVILLFASKFAYSNYKNWIYEGTTYYLVTKNKYDMIINDKGRFGEYITYLNLKKFESTGGKFLFNCYIPSGNNRTTEIDVLLICSRGLFVIESKNFSGWIFGNENNKYWMQSLPKRQVAKDKIFWFYNPILQNAYHIRHLRNLIRKYLPIWSIIVFSDRCEIKDLTVFSDVQVTNYSVLHSAVTGIYNENKECLTSLEIEAIYNQLYPYSQVQPEFKDRY